MTISGYILFAVINFVLGFIAGITTKTTIVSEVNKQ